MSRSFDGVDDNINFGDVNAYDALPDFTVMAWLYLNAVTADGGIITKRPTGASQPGWLLFFDDVASTGNDRISFFVDNGPGINRRVESTTVETAGAWHHWAGVLDDNADQMRLYKDAILNSSSGGATIAPGANAAVMMIGNSTDIGTRKLSGIVAYGQIFNRALTQNEIRQSMFFPGSITRGMIGFFPLLGATREVDYSSTGASGVVNGATVSSNNPPINGLFAFPKPEQIHVF